MRSESLAERIIDETLAGLDGADGFSPAMLEQLRQLARTGDIKKATQIVKIIRTV